MRYHQINRSVFLSKLFLSLLGLALATPLSLHAGAVSGPEGRALFEGYRDNHGGQFIDFTHGVAPMPADRRLDTEFLVSHGVIFETFQDLNLNPLGPHNVYVSTMSGRQNTIVGTPCVGCRDDGRYPYRMVFTEPQRYAGVLRNWNTSTMTQFYASDNSLLHEAANTTGVEFQGYEADSPDTATWVKRIEITGNLLSGHRQVGYTDDLFFGTVVPECIYFVIPAKNGATIVNCL